jgi:hypothetical protein
VVVENVELDDEALAMLAETCWQLHRAARARDVIEEHGETYTTGGGLIRPRPELQIENKAFTAFVRGRRELCLDIEPEDSRPPRLPR